MMLFHLPGGRPDQDGNLAVSKSGSDGGGEAVVEGAWWNPALAGPRGIFGGQVELRREILESEKTSRASGGANVKTQYRVWYQGKRMPRFGPELEAEVG